MRSALVDSGPLIALFDRDDRHHERVTGFLRARRLKLLTTWPVLTKVCALLPGAASLDFLEYVCRGGVEVASPGDGDLSAILSTSRKYADVPMDFADASLVVLAMRTGNDSIVLLDRDFDIYRLARNKSFRNLLAVTR